jgi:hypothetical protein
MDEKDLWNGLEDAEKGKIRNWLKRVRGGRDDFDIQTAPLICAMISGSCWIFE